MRTFSVTSSLIASLFFATTISPVEAQETKREWVPEGGWPIGYIKDPVSEARVGVLALNVAMTTGLCALVSLVEDRSNLSQDVAWCAGGGTIESLGMEMMAHPSIPALPGIGKRVIETGASIVENVVIGGEFGDDPSRYLRYSLAPIFPAMVEIDVSGEKTPSVFWSINPWLGLANGAASGRAELDIPLSLSWQSFVFRQEKRPETTLVGEALGDVVIVDPNYPGGAAHELAHVGQYVRFRPMQALAAKTLPGAKWLHDTAHYRMGEDLTASIFWIKAQVACAADSDLRACTRRWWIPGEVEAYVMQQAERE